jgi:hypothetical protein
MVLKTLGVPDEHYTAIGQVAALWAIFESLLDLTIWGLSGMDRQRSICITSQIAGTARKLDAILALAGLTPEGLEKLKPLNKIVEATHKLGEKRNRVVHDPWVFDNGTIFRLEATARKTLNYKNVAVDTDAIKSLQIELREHIRAYSKLMGEYLSGPPKSDGANG